MYAVYILQCNNQSYYTGLSNDLEKRIWQHEKGFFPNCYTFKRRPVKLRWHTIVETVTAAMQLEKQIKGWPRKKKEALMQGDIDELKRLSNLKTPDPEPGEGTVQTTQAANILPARQDPSDPEPGEGSVQTTQAANILPARQDPSDPEPGEGSVQTTQAASILPARQDPSGPEPGEGSVQTTQAANILPARQDPSPGSGSHLDILVIGQGICGTFLAWYLEKAGLSFMVIDESKPHTASKAAAGLINPVTGRRIVKTWMIDELLPFAWDTYRQIGRELDIACIVQKNIVDFFPGPQMRNAFSDRCKEDPQYLAQPGDEGAWRNWFRYDFGYGEIQPCYLIDLPVLLAAFRQKLIVKQKLSTEQFNINELTITENEIQYRQIIAKRIIFCDGAEGVDNPYFKNLPFAPNKGEALIVEIKDVPSNHIFKKGLSLVPLNNNLFWVGSSYEWSFENGQPTETFRKKTEQLLQEWLKTPFKILDHIASIRPATIERRPFAGFHPLQKNVGILNGMGSKGCSLAPYFARQLVQHLTGNFPLHPEADIQRFKKILSR